MGSPNICYRKSLMSIRSATTTVSTIIVFINVLRPSSSNPERIIEVYHRAFSSCETICTDSLVVTIFAWLLWVEGFCPVRERKLHIIPRQTNPKTKKTMKPFFITCWLRLVFLFQCEPSYHLTPPESSHLYTHPDNAQSSPISL